MAPKFGTSGLRGLVTEMTESLITDHVSAFLATCDVGDRVFVGQDLRPSSPRIAATVISAVTKAGFDAVDCGALPTPALALAAQMAAAGAIMVTGSHIPADRNGLKFYSATGEITKPDETRIRAALEQPGPAKADVLPGKAMADDNAGSRFVARYVDAFGANALTGRRIGLYSHSAVGRDLLAQTLTGLGAQVMELGRSDMFIPVDTEAVDPETRDRLAGWATRHGLEAIASTDGDSDRPMLTDAAGELIAGDILGQITAAYLGAETVVTPVSSNSGVTRLGFSRVIQTRIGSPFVIAGMNAAGGKVAGYEANGGFLLGYSARGCFGPLPSLPTRDSFLPIIVPLLAAGSKGLFALVAAQPPVFTASDRLSEVSTTRANALVNRLTSDQGERTRFLGFTGRPEAGLDLTDGLRITLTDRSVVHIRPSGNAPELRLYVETDTPEQARALLLSGLALLSKMLAGPEA